MEALKGGQSNVVAANFEPRSTVVEPRPITTEPRPITTEPRPISTEPKQIPIKPQSIQNEPRPFLTEAEQLIPGPPIISEDDIYEQLLGPSMLPTYEEKRELINSMGQAEFCLGSPISKS